MSLPLRDLPEWPYLMDIEAIRLAVGGVSATTIRKHVRDDKFPTPVSVFGRQMWKRDEIMEWVAALGSNTVQSPRPKRLGERRDDHAR